MRIGVDMASVARIAHSLFISSSWAASVFSSRELQVAALMPVSRAQEYLAGRFAVKEAVLKTLHASTLTEIALTDIETTSTEDGSPGLSLFGSALRAAESFKLMEWQVSISHENGLAIAFVVAQ